MKQFDSSSFKVKTKKTLSFQNSKFEGKKVFHDTTSDPTTTSTATTATGTSVLMNFKKV